jgi:mRNA-degrading endonuclease RelE of RelBE toxin-antitoxin system
MAVFKNISRLPEFDEELGKLGKRFRTIRADLEIFIDKQLYLYHKLRIDNRGIFQISGLSIDNPRLFKAKKFACRSLPGKGVQSGIRIIYAYFEKQDKIELVEIYFKGDKETEDRRRITKYYGKSG